MTTLRPRTTLPPKDRHAPSAGKEESTPSPRAYYNTSDPDPDDGPSRLSVLDVLRVLGGLALLSSALSYFVTGDSVLWGHRRPAITRPARIRAWLVRQD